MNRLWECVSSAGGWTKLAEFRQVFFSCQWRLFFKKQNHVSLPDLAAGQGILLQGGALNCSRKSWLAASGNFMCYGSRFYSTMIHQLQQPLLMGICAMSHRIYFLLKENLPMEYFVLSNVFSLGLSRGDRRF